MNLISKNFNPDKAVITLTDDQPKADTSVKYFFKSNFTKPEIYITLVAIAIITALFIAPIAPPIALSTAITLGTLVIIFDIGMLLSRSLLIPSGGILGKIEYNSNFFGEDRDQNASVTLFDGITLRGSWVKDKNTQDKPLSEKTLLLVFGGNGTIATKSEYRFLNRGDLDRVRGEIFDHLQINYRGTNNSDGLFGSHKDHVKDGIQIFAAAKKLGYKNIKIVGHSLGGSIAPHVKAYFDEKSTDRPADIYLYNTFYRLDEFLSSHSKNPVLKAILKVALKFFFACSGWDYRYTVKEWEKLKGKKRALGGGSADTVIRPSIELSQMLKSNGKTTPEVEVSSHTHMDPSTFRNFLHPEKSTSFRDPLNLSAAASTS